jgi:hypothetical protein
MQSNLAAPGAERLVKATMLAIESVALNSAAIFICDRLLSGFTVHGLSSYVVAAVAIELPTLAFMVVANFWLASLGLTTAREPWLVARWVWIGGSFVVFLALPLLVSTCLPGLLVAELVSPGLSIEGGWTYAASCAITAVILLSFRRLRALNWLRAFLRDSNTVEANAED